MTLKHIDPFSRGDIIDRRYRVDDVKRGNMGVVYLCEDIQRHEPIAIKTIDNRFLNTEANRSNFFQEASTWIHLERHPNIVEARALRLIDDHPYLFLERVIADNPRGATLKDLLFTQTIDYRRILQIGVHICDGMIHALKKIPTLVHRDLKSENILIGKEGLPKISDFGMTMRPIPEIVESPKYSIGLDLPVPLTELARRMEGTPAYASPEQCQCLPLDTRSDIYSLGCLFYHLSTRQLPFHRATVEETILAHVRETPTPPIERNRTVPRDFSRLILTCLEKNPRNRFDSFDSVRMELIDLYEFSFYESPKTFCLGLPLTIEEYIERAKSFALLDQYIHARSELMKALNLDSTRSDVYYLLGRYSYKEREYKRALQEFTEAARGIKNDAEFQAFFGKTYQSLSFYNEAEFHYKESIRLAPENDSVYHDWITILFHRNQMQKAESLLYAALRCCRDKSSFLRRLIELYERMDRKNELYETLKELVLLDPDDAISLIRLAELSLESKHPRYAMEWMEKAAKIHPKSFRDLYRLGLLFLAQKNPRRASEIWKTAAATGEGNGAFYRELATLLQSLRLYDDAWVFILRAEEKGEDVGPLKIDIQARRLKSR